MERAGYSALIYTISFRPGNESPTSTNVVVVVGVGVLVVIRFSKH